MKYICLGYIEEKKWETMSESERNAFMDECLPTTTSCGRTVILLAVKRCKAFRTPSPCGSGAAK